MKVEVTPFEVRCERCNVTFPIETKRCIHCGGRIDPSNLTETGIHDANVDLRLRTDGAASKPIDVMSDRFEQEVEMPEENMSVGRTLIRSLGGLIWVIVLIGFTLARSCGGE